MRNTGREIIDVLERVCQLEWFRYARRESADATAYAPITVWRFGSAANAQLEHIINVLRLILLEFSGNVSWTLKFSGRNWVLLPTKVQELEESGRFRTDGEVLNHLFNEDASFGLKAYEDLARIADILAERLAV